MSDPTDVADSDSIGPVQLHRLPKAAASQSPFFGIDLLVLFLAPAVILTVIFVTTDPSTFEYDIADPTLWGIYTSNFSHRSWGHLAGNLFGFLLIAGLEYLLLTVAGYRSYFFAGFALCLVVVPLFSHLFLQFFLVHQPVFHSYEAVGFSEPIAALTAFFPLALTIYYRSVSGFQLPFLTALLLYSGSVGIALAKLFGLSVNALSVGAIGIVGIVIVLNHLYRFPAVSSQQRREYAITSLFALCVFLALLFGLFPGTNTGTMVGHLAGYLPGFFVPFGLIWGFAIFRSRG